MKTKLCLLLLLVMALTACYKESYFDDLVDTDVIKIVAPLSNEVLADRVSTIDIKAEIPKNSAKDRSTVEFSTTEGIFIGSKEPLKATSEAKNGIATVTLVSSNKPLDVSIRAVIAQKEANIKIKFVNAPPEDLSIILGKLILKSGLENELGITVKATRKKGTPSIGNTISVQALDNNEKQIGVYRLGQEVAIDENGLANFTFSVDKNIKGEIKFKAFVKGKDSPSDTKIITIQE